MKKAEKLLTTTDISISEIMKELGFTNSTHFYKLFKEKYGTTPKKYRDNKRKYM
ncbi:helix-turn-helix domain-containing protein [Klebsiella pneumoniae]|uniref:helix-turn-helix domain-containing protein n=1 Tax=Klebsiella pneumoniae TaxID=573 RepID=UPI003AF93F8C